MNLHTPERAPGESQERYRERRKQSQRVVKSITRGGPDAMPNPLKRMMHEQAIHRSPE